MNLRPQFSRQRQPLPAKIRGLNAHTRARTGGALFLLARGGLSPLGWDGWVLGRIRSRTVARDPPKGQADWGFYGQVRKARAGVGSRVGNVKPEKQIGERCEVWKAGSLFSRAKCRMESGRQVSWNEERKEQGTTPSVSGEGRPSCLGGRRAREPQGTLVRSWFLAMKGGGEKVAIVSPYAMRCMVCCHAPPCAVREGAQAFAVCCPFGSDRFLQTPPGITCHAMTPAPHLRTLL